MARAPFQVLIILYRIVPDGDPLYAVFRRADLDVWQMVSGGGEDQETPEQAARRELREETGLDPLSPLMPLSARGSVPAHIFRGHERWGPELREIPEYSFGVEVPAPASPVLSPEHREYVWLIWADAMRRLEWESNRAALRELHERLTTRREPLGLAE
jgi:dihydroneopterin triphosphate diphosphatase